jgi:hypothetical protein
MSNEASPVSPEPEMAPSTAATPATDFPQAAGPQPQSAFSYPDTDAPRPRPRGRRLALLIVGAAVVAAVLFGGGFWAGSAVGSIPGMSHSRFGDDPRVGPGGRMDHGPLPGGDHDDSDTDTMDPSNVEG